MGLKGWEPEGWGPEGWEGPKFRAFFPSPVQYFVFFLTLGLLVELWPRFKAMTQPIVRVLASLEPFFASPGGPKGRQGFTQ